MSLNNLHFNIIAKLCPRAVFADAQDYYQAGRVLEINPVGRSIHAKVSGVRPYNIQISEQADQIIATSDCGCAKDAPFCKHSVAVLLAWAAQSKRRYTTNELKQRLSGHSPDELIAMLASAVDHYPFLTDLLALAQPEAESIYQCLITSLQQASTNPNLTQKEFIAQLSPFCQEAEQLFNLGEYEPSRRALYLVIKTTLDFAKQYLLLWEILPTSFLAVCGRRYVQIALSDPESYHHRNTVREEARQILRHKLAHRIAFDFSAILNEPTTNKLSTEAVYQKLTKNPKPALG
jgi:uncharacterized Zn finger protein